MVNIKLFKSIFLDLISFNTPQARTINFFIILILSAIFPVDKLYLLPIRSIYELLSIPAYSIGLTRAMSSVMHLDFVGAWAYNKLIIVVFPLILILFIFNLVKSIKIYKKTKKFF